MTRSPATEIQSVYLDDRASVTMLGTGKELKWTKEPGRIAIEIPGTLKKPTKNAYVLKLEME